MPRNDNGLDPQDGLISAAHAAASWVRARRANWTSAPLNPVAASAALPAADFLFEPSPADAPLTVETVPDPIAAPARLPRPSWGSRPMAARVRALVPGALLLRWIARGAITSALVVAATVGVPYLWNALPALPERTAPAESKPAVATVVRKPAGSLRVSSTPAGARVLVDGKARGVTPLDLTDLSPGRHEVALQSSAGSVKRTVTVAANATVTIDEAIFSGFVTVYSPFEVTVSEGERVLRADDRQQIMLPPGTHELRMVNRALDYDVVRRVEVTPGEATSLQLSPVPSTLTVTSASAAEVWLDGTRLGEAPVNAAPVPIGVHEILVRRAGGGERRFSVTVGTKPFTLNADF